MNNCVRNIKCLFIFSLFIQVATVYSFDKVVIWGYKLHTHTHSYIHNGFYRAFKHLGYDTYWFDDQDDTAEFDFSNSLFLTEGQVDKKIPLRMDCDYILHYCDQQKYEHLFDVKRCVVLQVYNNNLSFYDSLGNEVMSKRSKKEDLIQVDKCIFYDLVNKIIFMPWATDLLPDEIDEIKKQIPFFKKLSEIYWVGSLGGGPGGNIDEIKPFENACSENGIKFIHSNPWVKGVSVKENIKLIQHSYMAPAIVGTWQNEVGYIPCRIFKNISYGQMGITNSKTVYDLFEGKIIYNSNTYQLFYDAQERMKTMKIEELYELMDIVKEKHTYLDRIERVLNLFEIIRKESSAPKN